MDSLTQIVLGAAVAEAVVGKNVGNRAVLYGAIAGTIPDLDVLATTFTDTLTATEIHRGFTHSILFSLLLASPLGWLLSKIEHKANLSWKQWSLMFFLCLVTHPLLDAFTTWGTQLFWPLDLRLAFKSIFVIDPLYTLPFLVFLVLTMFQKKTSPKRQKYNRLGLLISSSYLLLTVIFKGFAYTSFQNALEQQAISYKQLQVKPGPLTTVLWNANVETETSFLIGEYSFFDSQPITFYEFPKNHQLVENLKENPDFKRLENIAQGWYIIENKNDELYFNDLRFGLLNRDFKRPNFAFSYKVEETATGSIKISENEKSRDDAQQLLNDLWKRILGN